MRTILVYAFALALSAPVAAEEALPLIGDVASGMRLYRANCTACHGFDGSGRGPVAAVLKVKPADHRDGSRMNARDDPMLFDTVQLGCARRGCSPAMPAFSDLSPLEVWDLVAYSRSLHLSLRDFFPAVERYIVKDYTIGEVGNAEFKAGQRERLKKAGKIDPADLKRTVFTLYKAEVRRVSPELVLQEPRKLAELNRADKLGFVLFLPFTSPRGKPMPIGLSFDTNYTLVKILVAEGDPALASETNKRFEKYQGLGKRGEAPSFQTGRDALSKAFDESVLGAYLLAVEAVNAYELEERDRSWADDAF